uniref:Similar to helicase n=1 Tax=Alternaria alternata TaxID=5599 RepID=C9K7G6_ALTAL|nr:similar to helicase [Alternaria alternata]
MALKHLLNDEDIGDNYHNDYRPHLKWNQDDDTSQSAAALPTQSWNQYVNELLGSHAAHCDAALEGEQVDFYSAFEETSAEIERWATGDVSFQPPDKYVPEETFICYGMIFRAAVRLRGNMIELSNRLNRATLSPIHGHAQMVIIKSETQFLVAFDDGAVVGEVNAQLDKALSSIAEQGYEIDSEVFAPTRAIQETIGRATKEKEAVIRVQVNVYGPPAAANEIGRELSRQKIYLQRPAYVRDGSKYENPHMLTLPGFVSSTAEAATSLEEREPEKPSLQTIRSTIQEVYLSLTRDHSLRGLEGDKRLNTALLLHQKTALAFMTQREDGPIPEKYALWKATEEEGVRYYRHAVTNARCIVEPTETGGGILADEMGMGKTLSILALVIQRLNAAHDWAAQIDVVNDGSWQIRKGKHRSGATLIVASSDLMINEWFQELEKHFDEQSRTKLKAIKYHGPRRHISKDKFVEADIVITTYHTLASDFAGTKGALRDIEWYCEEESAVRSGGVAAVSGVAVLNLSRITLALGRCIPVAKKAFNTNTNTNVSVKHSHMPSRIARGGHSFLLVPVPNSLSAKVKLLGVVWCSSDLSTIKPSKLG